DLKTHRIVSQALVIGDRRPYIAALVTLDPDVANGLDEGAVHAAVSSAVDAVNTDRSRFEQIKRFQILPRDFTIEHDEVTPTLKLRSKVILDHFAAEIDELYASDPVSDTEGV